MNRLFAILALLIAFGCAPAGAQRREGWREVEVTVAPVVLGADEVGRLRFRGGLELTSAYWEFGGFSGLEVLGGDQVYAINDNGQWLQARLELDDEGNLVGLSGVRMAAMLDENGEAFTDKLTGDSEGLAALADGRFAVSFEQTQTIRIYDLLGAGPEAAAVAGPSLAEIERLAPNSGLEALAVDAEGQLVVGAEGGFFRTRVWRAATDLTEPAPPTAWYSLRTGYFLVGIDQMPNGQFVSLERAYAPSIGSRIRLSVFGAEDLAAGSIDAIPLGRIARPLEVDNFEAIGAVALADGTTRFYIISDDNFSDAQRTLLFAFDLIEPENGVNEATDSDEGTDRGETPSDGDS